MEKHTSTRIENKTNTVVGLNEMNFAERKCQPDGRAEVNSAALPASEAPALPPARSDKSLSDESDDDFNEYCQVDPKL